MDQSDKKPKILKVKKRPPRVYVTKTGKFYIMKDGKKVYIQIPKTEKALSQKQLQKQVVNVVLTHPRYYVPIRRRKRTFSKSGRVYFQKPFMAGMIGSKFGFANTQKSLIGKEKLPGIYEPHTLPNYTPRPTLNAVQIPMATPIPNADVAVQNIPNTLDKETQESYEENYKTLVNKGIRVLKESLKAPRKKNYSAMTTTERREYFTKLQQLYPDYNQVLEEAKQLTKDRATALLRKTNLSKVLHDLVQNIDEFIPMFQTYPHDMRDEIISNLYKERFRKTKEKKVAPEESKQEGYKREEKEGEEVPEPPNAQKAKNERITKIARSILPPIEPTKEGKEALKLLDEEKQFLKGLNKKQKRAYKVIKGETNIFNEDAKDMLDELGYYDRRDELRDKFREQFRKEGLRDNALTNAVKREVERDEKLNKIKAEVQDILEYEDAMNARILLEHVPEIEKEDILKSNILKVEELPSNTNEARTNSEMATEAEGTEATDNLSDISGAGKYSNWKKGLYDTEIHKIMEHKAKRFVPVIMSDEIPKLLPYVTPKTREFGFIINSTSSKTSGQHWRAVFIDVPNSEIDYYDSLVSSPSKEFLRDIKLLVDKINPNTYMKLKINMIKQQDDHTENCGFFACKFIIDRYKNKPFKNACGADKSDMGEYEIEKFKNYL